MLNFRTFPLAPSESYSLNFKQVTRLEDFRMVAVVHREQGQFDVIAHEAAWSFIGRTEVWRGGERRTLTGGSIGEITDDVETLLLSHQIEWHADRR